MPLNRLKTKTMIECLWPYILSLMKDTPVYAYEIRSKIKERYSFEIGNVTAYMILYKLETGGYVRTEWLVKENRQRKYYKITDKGKELLKEGTKYLNNLSKTLSK